MSACGAGGADASERSERVEGGEPPSPSLRSDGPPFGKGGTTAVSVLGQLLGVTHDALRGGVELGFQ